MVRSYIFFNNYGIFFIILIVCIDAFFEYAHVKIISVIKENCVFVNFFIACLVHESENNIFIPTVYQHSWSSICCIIMNDLMKSKTFDSPAGRVRFVGMAEDSPFQNKMANVEYLSGEPGILSVTCMKYPEC